jgi:glutamine synthetase
MAAGMLTFEELKREIAAGTIDTVIAAMVDLQGRLVGKRFHAEYFADSGHEETHGCNYLLGVDIEMEPVPGYKAASWDLGYGDFTLKPDMATLRRVPWLPGTALVICDVVDHHHEDVPHSPRAMLKKQLRRLEAMKLKANVASELEFFLFDDSYDSAHQKGYRNLKTAGHYIEDYHILQTTKDEVVMRALRNGLQGAGIPVENSKGEWGPGQEEINVRYAEALEMADRHAIIKNGAKEIAYGLGKAITFMAKWDYGMAGSSCHVHQSLWSKDGKSPLLFPGTLHQLLQALHGGHLCPDARRLELRQPHRGLSGVRRQYQGHPRRVPHRRRGPQSVPRLRGTDRRGSRRRGEADEARARLLGRRL